MTWSSVKKALTTPPSPRPPPPKYPLFTTDFFSTKSFGPGHLVGAVVLVGGLFGVTKFIIARSDAARRLAQPQSPRRSEDEPNRGQVENARGQYGKKP